VFQKDSGESFSVHARVFSVNMSAKIVIKERKFSLESDGMKAGIKIVIIILLLLVGRTYATPTLHHYSLTVLV